MKKIALLLLLAPLFLFSQRGRHKENNNIFHNRDFWKTNPSVEIVKQKISEGNDAVKQNRGAFDAVCFAIMAKAPLSTIEYLLSLPGNDINKSTHDARSYLMWAGYTGEISVMKMLLKKGADVNHTGSHGYTWFTFTLNAGHQNTKIYDLMAKNGVDLKSTNRNNANAILLIAPHAKDTKIIKYFEKKGVDIHATDKDENDILFYAAKKGNIDLIKKYISKGFDYQKINKKGENLVLFASKGGRRDSNSLEVYQYLDGLGLDMKLINKNKQTALHSIARNTKDIAVVDFFIKKGVNIHQIDKDGNTAFMNAVKGNNSVVIEKLISEIKDVNQQNKEGFSALTFATQRINTEVFKTLKAKGANTNITDNDGNNLFYHLFNSYGRRNDKNFEAYALELEQAKVSAKNVSKKESLLHVAITKQERALIQKALALGVDVNQKNKDGLTPLHLAAMKTKKIKLLKMLLKKGADKNILTDFEESVYDLAQENELLSKQDISFLKQ